MLKELKTSH